jgi:hypothetical protein
MKLIITALTIFLCLSINLMAEPDLPISSPNITIINLNDNLLSSQNQLNLTNTANTATVDIKKKTI